MTDPELYSAPSEPSNYALEFRTAEEWHALHQARHHAAELGQARQLSAECGDLASSLPGLDR